MQRSPTLPDDLQRRILQDAASDAVSSQALRLTSLGRLLQPVSPLEHAVAMLRHVQQTPYRRMFITCSDVYGPRAQNTHYRREFLTSYPTDRAWMSFSRTYDDDDRYFEVKHRGKTGLEHTMNRVTFRQAVDLMMHYQCEPTQMRLFMSSYWPGALLQTVNIG